jgi:hypothetical protein
MKIFFSQRIDDRIFSFNLILLFSIVVTKFLKLGCEAEYLNSSAAQNLCFHYIVVDRIMAEGHSRGRDHMGQKKTERLWSGSLALL